MQKKGKLFYTGTGKRKSAVAKITVKPGDGGFSINNKDAKSYLQYNFSHIAKSLSALTILGLESSYNIRVMVSGGGLNGQAEAIKLGIARAICSLDTNHKTALKSQGLLTRDSRVKERKKYGLRKARKAPQFSKR